MTIQKLYNADSSVEWMEKRISRKKLLRSKSTESTGRSDPHINTDAVFTSSQKYDHYDDLKKMNILSTHSGVSINASATPPNYKLRRKSTGKKRKIRSKSTHKPKAKVKDDTSSREGSGNLPIRKSPKEEELHIKSLLYPPLKPSTSHEKIHAIRTPKKTELVRQKSSDKEFRTPSREKLRPKNGNSEKDDNKKLTPNRVRPTKNSSDDLV